jgi:hypothetical protein
MYLTVTSNNRMHCIRINFILWEEKYVNCSTVDGRSHFTGYNDGRSRLSRNKTSFQEEDKTRQKRQNSKTVLPYHSLNKPHIRYTSHSVTISFTSRCLQLSVTDGRLSSSSHLCRPLEWSLSSQSSLCFMRDTRRCIVHQRAISARLEAIHSVNLLWGE